jgi:hypothetical protein
MSDEVTDAAKVADELATGERDADRHSGAMGEAEDRAATGKGRTSSVALGADDEGPEAAVSLPLAPRSHGTTPAREERAPRRRESGTAPRQRTMIEPPSTTVDETKRVCCPSPRVRAVYDNARAREGVAHTLESLVCLVQDARSAAIANNARDRAALLAVEAAQRRDLCGAASTRAAAALAVLEDAAAPPPRPVAAPLATNAASTDATSRRGADAQTAAHSIANATVSNAIAAAIDTVVATEALRAEHAAERARLRSELTAAREEHAAELAGLQSELAAVRAELAAERSERQRLVVERPASEVEAAPAPRAHSRDKSRRGSQEERGGLLGSSISAIASLFSLFWQRSPAAAAADSASAAGVAASVAVVEQPQQQPPIQP